MAYSFQTFSVDQVLTAAHMNQVEVNIRDHIHGTAGVRAFVRGTELPAEIAYEDEANTFTAKQTIKYAAPYLALDANTGTNIFIQFLENATQKALLEYVVATDIFYVMDSVASPQLGVNTLTGEILTYGTISPALGTITTNIPILDATATWNAGGVTFDAIKIDITDTASAAASKVLDLQVDSTSVFTVKSDGDVTTGNTYSGANTFSGNNTLSGTNTFSGTFTLTGSMGASGWPSFHVHKNASNQTDITGIQKVTWSTEDWDTNSDFDNATNYRFTPTVAGKYLLVVSILPLVGSWSAGDYFSTYIYKNGSAHRQKRSVMNTTSIAESFILTAIVDANGSTDYFEVYADATGSTMDIDGFDDYTYWSGTRIG